MPYALVFVGAGLGGLVRFVVSNMLRTEWPWATFGINILGSLVIGIVVGLVEHHKLGEAARTFLAVGICGGFTTFSTFSLESVRMIEKGQWVLASLYVATSAALSLLACAAGLRIAS